MCNIRSFIHHRNWPSHYCSTMAEPSTTARSDDLRPMHPGRGLARFFHLHFITHTLLPIMNIVAMRQAVLARGDFSHAWRVTDERSYRQWVRGAALCNAPSPITTGAEHCQGGKHHGASDGAHRSVSTRHHQHPPRSSSHAPSTRAWTPCCSSSSFLPWPSPPPWTGASPLRLSSCSCVRHY